MVHNKTEKAMPVENVSPLVLFCNTSAGSGEAEKLIDLWREVVPEDRRGSVYAVRDKAQYDEELHKAISYCEEVGAILVVAGGDGTFNGVLTQVVDKNITLGLIPTGTFNFFARSHGIPEDTREAIEYLLTARPVVVPLAYVNNRPFVVSVSIGVHPKVIAEREVHTRYVGRSRLAAWISGIWTILRARHVTRAVLRTQHFRRQIVTPLLLINFNSAQLLGLDDRFQFKPDKLAVLRLKKASYRGIFVFLIRALSGRVLDEGSLECQYVEDLDVETPKKRVRVALDGELLSFQSPLHFRVQKEGFSCLLAGRLV